MQILKAQLPWLLKRLRKITDPRNPKKIKHSLTLLMLYGLLMFVFQMSSRRQANREMTRPQFTENLHLLFPELEKLPHADSLYRLLGDIEVEQIEDAHIGLIRRLIAKKKFSRYLINNCYPVAMDGTQKMPFHHLWCKELLQRKCRKGKQHPNTDEADSVAEADNDDEDSYQYYVYVLETNLVFQNGMVIPLLSEFLEYEQGDMENNKQDCETRAFKRTAKRLKSYFPRLPILLLLDGLYANGPVMALCKKYNWQFMIVLKDDSLPTVWEEFNSLLKLQNIQQSNRCQQQAWGERSQHFNWVNNIDYYFGARNTVTIHVVTCEEEWEEVDDTGEIILKHSRHAWISSRSLNRNNVHERCNLGARHRWGIEACILVEKHQGYHYEHCFALNWNAMKGSHYLMRLAHLFNTLARFSCALSKQFRDLGVRGFIEFIYSTLTGPWLKKVDVINQLSRPFQLRLE